MNAAAARTASCVATRGVHGLVWAEGDSPVTLKVILGCHGSAITLPCVVADPRGFAVVAVPDGYEDLLTRPLFGHLATTRPDGTVQVNPMWFEWDGTHLRFTHTTKRQKYRNVTDASPGGHVDPRSGQPVPLPGGARRGGRDRARPDGGVLPGPQ